MRGQRFGLLSAERLAVVRINSLALRARIFSKQKSKPSNTSPTRKRASEWFARLSDNVFALCQRRIWPLRPPERALPVLARPSQRGG